MKLLESLYVLVLVGLITLVGNMVGPKIGIIDAIPGMIILILIAMAGILAAKYLPGGIPAVAYVVTIGCIVTYPDFPGAAIMNKYIAKVNFLALCTPILAYAGVAIGRDLDALKRMGWRIVVVSCIVFIGTYIGSAIIAEAILKFTGQI